MGILTRADKGSPLTHDEADSNIIYLDKKNVNMSGKPTTSDDESKGFEVKSIWLDVDANKFYKCTDASANAAVWELLNFGANGLVETTENNGLGWRIFSRNKDYYKDIGYNAIDLSLSEADENNGATHDFSMLQGKHLRSTTDFSTWFGKYNVATSSDILFGIGNGADNDNRSNLLEIYKNGVILSPTLDVANLTDNNAFITVKYHTDNTLKLGDTDTTAYRGDYGKVAYAHSQTRHYVCTEGATADRPATPLDGTYYFDTDLAYPVWYRASSDKWVKYDGSEV